MGCVPVTPALSIATVRVEFVAETKVGGGTRPGALFCVGARKVLVAEKLLPNALIALERKL
jgi:hypothetical protein